MHLLHEAVQNAYLIAVPEQLIGYLRTDKPGPSRYQNPF
jgi:hypothetical protein